ncbi:sulfurtransferase TusA family protein [Enteractinococcus coprophilus]|uniref:tRNA 2-thiouridine synthesizing protein A n=1 Tax=Enteractinococcus coprophilus TaxID=1027633 RepID=A0A543A0H5_9MICC|nr:sulfurtransferase TusA family protein [Enteractinococcus coprophilus]TQL65996.1 tRNA 2-thiouridine synthesizing protein A [Enteractinococcus coprophilus]
MDRPEPNATWDAGDMGCGELIVKLKLKLRDELAAGDILQLTATDPGAPEDIPAWCRLTRNPLIYQDHPIYFIQTKE